MYAGDSIIPRESFRGDNNCYELSGGYAPPPNHPPGALPLDPAGGLPFPRPPVPPTSKSWLRHCVRATIRPLRSTNIHSIRAVFVSPNPSAADLRCVAGHAGSGSNLAQLITLSGAALYAWSVSEKKNTHGVPCVSAAALTAPPLRRRRRRYTLRTALVVLFPSHEFFPRDAMHPRY